MQVRAADAGRDDAQQGLAGTWNRIRALFDAYLPRTLKDEGTHMFSVLRDGRVSGSSGAGPQR
jgi:hypothetical protein